MVKPRVSNSFCKSPIMNTPQPIKGTRTDIGEDVEYKLKDNFYFDNFNFL